MKRSFYVMKRSFYVMKRSFYPFQLIEIQCVVNPSNKTKLYKYTNCVSREEKKAFRAVLVELPARGEQKSKTGPVKSFAHQGAARPKYI